MQFTSGESSPGQPVGLDFISHQMEEKFRILVEESPLPLALTENKPDGKILFANKALQNLMGAQPLIGQPAASFYKNIKDRENIRTLFKRRGSIRNVEAEFILSGWSEARWFTLNASRVTYLGKDCVVSSIQDNSELKRVRSELKNIQALQSQIMAFAPIGFYQVSPEGKIIFVNKKWLEISGLTLEENLEGQWLQLIHPDDLESVMKAWQAFVNGGSDFEEQYRYQRKDGQIIWVLTTGTCVRNAAGEATSYIGSVQDITEIKLNQDRAAHAVMGANDGIWDLDLRTNVFFLSKRAYEILGFSGHESELPVDLASLGANIHPDDHSKVFPALTKCIQQFEPFDEICRLRQRGDEYVWVHTRGKAVFDSFGKPIKVVGFVTDISAMKLAEERLHRSNIELKQFAYVASHDLQAPLRHICSYIELISKKIRVETDPDVAQWFQFVIAGAKKMRDTINDLLKYSSLEHQAYQFESVDLNHVVSEILDTLKPIVIETQTRFYVGELPKVMGCKTHLHQLLQNLIQNALKFRRLGIKPDIKIVSQEKNASYEITVEDNGVGIDSMHVDKIFQMFQTLHPKDQYPGTGIGLAICKKIIEIHGGKIRVESKFGEGSKFIFELPK